MCPAAAEPDAPAVLEWGHERLDDLTALCALAFPDEALASEDLELLCFAAALPPSTAGAVPPRTAVLGTADGTAVAVVSIVAPHELDAPDEPHESGRIAPVTAHLHLVAVHPARRRRGLGRGVVEAGQAWATGQGASGVAVGGASPFYLFSGVDTRWTEALCLFESLGYRRTAVVLDLVCPTLQSTRRPVPPGVVVQRVETDAQVAQLCTFAAASYPHWVEEFRRAGESGTAVMACDARDGRVLGAAAHSVSRVGVVGPVAVAVDGQRGGVGTALMGSVLSDLSTAGLRTAEIAWTSTVGFYAKACGARVGRASQLHHRNLRGVAEE